MDCTRKLTVLIVFVTRLKGLLSECSFPEYLRTPLPNGDERYWITETVYLGTSEAFEKQLEIRVKPNEISANMLHEARCSSGDGLTDCLHRQLKYKLTCVAEEPEGNYRVLITDHHNGNYAQYSCYKFEQRNKNVVQIWKSPLNEDNISFLCSPHVMSRDNWVWLAPRQEEWTSCPLHGGYNFKSYKITSQYRDYSNHDEAYCPNVRRRGRLESECIQGEGMSLEFSEAKCSPFNDHRTSVTLYCWAWWIEEDMTFIVMSMANKLPQFVLRYSADEDNRNILVGYFYFSPIIPKASLGMPHDGSASSLGAFKMKITKSEFGDGICYDEDRQFCSTYAHSGKCKSALHQFANYCKKSCGLCDNLGPNIKAECQFPEEVRNSWFYFLNGKPEEVNIRKENITFDSLGDFVCKGIIPSTDFNRYYKTVSYYQNGCRPRYTCIELGQYDENIVQFRISRSNVTDSSFKICKFRDDPQPIGNEIRSLQMKSLMPRLQTSFNECKLNGKIKVQSNLSTRKCTGTLSDWNSYPTQCKFDKDLKLQLHGHCNSDHGHASVYREFTCIASVSIKEGYLLLFTREIANNNQFTCWVIRKYADSMSLRPWLAADMLNHSNCASSYTFVHRPVISLSLRKGHERKEKPCERPDNRHTASPRGPTGSYQPEYNVGPVLKSEMGTSTWTKSSLTFTLICANIVVLFIMIR